MSVGPVLEARQPRNLGWFKKRERVRRPKVIGSVKKLEFTHEAIHDPFTKGSPPNVKFLNDFNAVRIKSIHEAFWLGLFTILFTRLSRRLTARTLLLPRNCRASRAFRAVRLFTSLFTRLSRKQRCVRRGPRENRFLRFSL